jgi:hypothetical protein
MIWTNFIHILELFSYELCAMTNLYHEWPVHAENGGWEVGSCEPYRKIIFAIFSDGPAPDNYGKNDYESPLNHTLFIATINCHVFYNYCDGNRLTIYCENSHSYFEQKSYYALHIP